MKKSFVKSIVLAAALSLPAAVSAKAPYPDSTFTIGTYNLWAASARDYIHGKGKCDARRLWDSSKDIMVQAFKDMDLDIVCLQEASGEMVNYLRKALSDAGLDYRWEIFLPNESAPDKQAFLCIIYRKSRYSASNKFSYWLSPTPEVQSYGWDEKNRYRIGGYVELKDRITGKSLCVTVAHCPLKPVARENAATIIRNYTVSLNKKGCVPFILGDMNAKDGDPFTIRMHEWCADSYLVSPRNNGYRGTFAGGAQSDSALDSIRIDYVYIQQDYMDRVEVLDYTVFAKKYDIGGGMFYPSDHCPVFIKAKFKN